MEQRKQCQRNGGHGKVLLCEATAVREQVLGTNALHHEKVGRIAYKAANIIAKRQTETDYNPNDADNAHHYETLQHGAYHILGSHHASIKECKPRCHHQHKNSGRNHPRNVGILLCSEVGQIEIRGGTRNKQT